MRHKPHVPSPPDSAEGQGQRGEATDTAYRRLYRLAHHLGPNAKLPPVRQLREEFGVSRSTLDAALTRLERQRVLLRRERSGVYVAPHLRERSICLLCEPSYFLSYGGSPFWSLLVDHIRKTARQGEIRLSIVFANLLPPGQRPPEAGEDSALLPEHLAADVEAGKVHGLLAIGLPHSTARWIEARGVPTVAFAGAAQYIVSISASDMIQMGVAALARQGCRRLMLWKQPDDLLWEGRSRFLDDVFLGALAAHGLAREAGAIYRVPPPAASLPPPSHVEVGWQAATECFGPGVPVGDRCDGVVSCDDMMTQGGLMAMQRLGVLPGRDVQVATHVNSGSPALLGWQDELFRIEYDLDEIVRLMFETLDALIEGPETEQLVFEPAEDIAAVTERYRLVHPSLRLPSTETPPPAGRS